MSTQLLKIGNSTTFTTHCFGNRYVSLCSFRRISTRGLVRVTCSNPRPSPPKYLRFDSPTCTEVSRGQTFSLVRNPTPSSVLNLTETDPGSEGPSVEGPLSSGDPRETKNFGKVHRCPLVRFGAFTD